MDISSNGVKMFYGNHKYLKIDADVYLMFIEHEGLRNIYVYAEEDKAAPPIPFRMPYDESNQALCNLLIYLIQRIFRLIF